MKVLAVLLLALAVATGYPVVKTWTLDALEDAVVNSKADPSMMPYIMDAVNQILEALFTGNRKYVHAVVPSPSGGSTWTVEELTAALEHPATKEEYRIMLQAAATLVERRYDKTGDLQENVVVIIPALDISTWTQSDLEEALRSPSTKPALMPYLEKAHIELKEALEKGEARETINMVTPVGLIAHKGDYEYLIKRLKNLVKKTKKGL